MIKRMLVIAVAAGAIALPAVASADKGGTPNAHSPAWQCRKLGLSPHNRPGWSQCVRQHAHNNGENNDGENNGKPGDEANKPTENTDQSGTSHGQSDQPHGQANQPHGQSGS